MNILIVTLGSRGDVQPYVALGKGLQAAGHTVTVCTSSSFESFITGHGLNYGYMGNDLMDLMDSAEGRDAIENTVGIWGSIRTTMKLIKQANAINRRLMQDTWAAVQAAQPDLVIYHPKALAGPHIAEKLGIPVILALPAPLIVPTGDFPAIGLPNLKLGAGYNRFSYGVIKQGYSTYGKLVNEFRQTVLQLDPMKDAALPRAMGDGQPIPVLHAVSPHVVPRPADWPPHIHMSGYWFLDQEAWQPSAELQAFLDAGDAPVYVGFGSMAGKNPQKLARIVIDALQQANLRGVIATGWGGLDAGELPGSIFKIDHAPHDWLFPRMAAVVHHGGAGTTAAGLRAGCPTVICSFIADQPFWGQRVRALGAGSEPIPHKKLTADKLAAALREVTTDPAIRQQAAALGEKLRQEDGIANAIAVIEALPVKAKLPAH
ncbi:MAG: glycosyltransferase [Anaerolineae bacterium]|nr:glycosyltransferase [Anaerolineae bacterium]